LKRPLYRAKRNKRSITKSTAASGGAISASAEFAYDASYQRIRQVKRSGAVGSGSFVDDILYVIPGGFEAR
jgi:hypothetical protein